MSCRELRDALLLHAAGELEGAELHAVESHLDSGCPVCAGRLCEARAVVGLLPFALEPTAPSADTKEALMDRVRGSVGTPTETEVRSPERPSSEPSGGGFWPVLSPVLGAAAAAALVYFALVAPTVRELGELKQKIATLTEELTTVSSQRDAGDVWLARPGHLVEVRIEGQDEVQPTASAHLLVDPQREAWRFAASGVRRPGDGRTFQLWLVTGDGEKISAGVFDADASGRVVAEGGLPIPLDEVALVAITDEPSGGVPQPTGSFQFLGATSG